MADAPEDLERVEREERARVLRVESQAIAAAFEEDRRRFDRHVRAAGVFAALAGFGLSSMAPLTGRGAILAGAAFLGGTVAALIGAQGGTRPETMPTWTRWALGVAGAVGAGVGLAYLQ